MGKFKKEKKILLASFVSALIITVIFSSVYSLKLYADSTQKGIADKIVRLHIVAESDSLRDQELKLKIRDETLKLMQNKTENCKTKEESIDILFKSKNEIKSCAENVLKENNCKSAVNVDFENSLFPSKKYGDIALPAGFYDALKITVGNGKGHNWWCVMYPSLCFYDAEKDNQKLENILTPVEYSVVYDPEGINIRFAVVFCISFRVSSLILSFSS